MVRRLAALVVFGVLLVAAAPAEADITVNNVTPSSAAGARTQYVITFTTSATLKSGDTVTVAFAGGTTFGGWNGGNVFDGATRIGSCSEPAAGSLVSQCSLFAGATDNALHVMFAGITNPPTATTTETVTVATSADPATPSSSFTVAAGHSLSTPTVVNTLPSDASGARTQYTVTFATSSTGGLSSLGNSTVSVTFPSGTGFPSGFFGNVFNASGTRIGSCGTPSGLTSTCAIFDAGGAAAGETVKVVFNGVANPTVQATTPETLNVTTTSDTPSVPSSSYSVEPQHPLSTPTVVNSSPSHGAGARTQYTVKFTTSATGGLSSLGNSSLSIAFPTGTTFPSGFFGNVFNGSTRIGSCGTPSAQAPLTSVCSIFDSTGVGPNQQVTIVFDGIANPTTASTTLTLSASTTSDTASVPSSNYTVEAGQSLSALTVDNTFPSDGAGARTQYTVKFTTSATGGLSSLGNSSLSIAFPTGTTFPSGFFGNVFNGSTRIGSCGTPSAQAPLTSVCSIFDSTGVGPNQQVTVVFDGIANATSAGANKTVSATTTSDLPSVNSGNYVVASSNPLTGLTATPASSAQSAVTTYNVTFNTSSTGGLSSLGNSSISVTFPSGTTFPSGFFGNVFKGSTRIGSCGTPSAQTPLTSVCSIFDSAGVGPQQPVSVVFSGVGNPSTANTYHVTATTTSDTTPVDSGNYGIAVDTTPPTPAIVSGPPATTTATSATFTFSANEAGTTFQCSLDGAPLADCTTPYVVTGLAPGVHTFSVRATDPAGNTSPTPATETFTVAAPAQATPTPSPSPSPAPTPMPTPTPVPGKTVVAAPVSGSVLVKKPGTHTFVEVDSAQGIPLGSTVDTTHGVAQITAKSGQVANFYDGIFKITQTRTTTDLTLTQPLACGKAGKASAAAKKRKSRKLWGDGSGSFRTRGQYSSATVRGTKWLVQDTCADTLTKVARGVVSVTDNVKHKTILLKTGKQYRARPRR